MLGLGVLQGQPLTTGYSLRLCVGGESSLKTFFFHVCVWNLQEYEVCLGEEHHRTNAFVSLFSSPVTDDSIKEHGIWTQPL